MPTVASDIAGPVRKSLLLHKQNLEPAVIYNRYRYVSNTKPARFYMYLNGLTCNSFITRKLEEPKKDGKVMAPLMAPSLRKGNVNVKVSKDITNTADHSAITSDSLRDSQLNALRFTQALAGLIPPRSRSDRTCFRNVANWLIEGCRGGRFTGEIFSRVLDYAKQARQGNKPAAVFMSILKEELGYEKKVKSESDLAKTLSCHPERSEESQCLWRYSNVSVGYTPQALRFFVPLRSP
jgi:hypothetical protein